MAPFSDRGSPCDRLDLAHRHGCVCVIPSRDFRLLGMSRNFGAIRNCGTSVLSASFVSSEVMFWQFCSRPLREQFQRGVLLGSRPRRPAARRRCHERGSPTAVEPLGTCCSSGFPPRRWRSCGGVAVDRGVHADLAMPPHHVIAAPPLCRTLVLKSQRRGRFGMECRGILSFGRSCCY